MSSHKGQANTGQRFNDLSIMEVAFMLRIPHTFYNEKHHQKQISDTQDTNPGKVQWCAAGERLNVSLCQQAVIANKPVIVWYLCILRNHCCCLVICLNLLLELLQI